MRIKLLNDGTYDGLKKVNFPVEVDCEAEISCMGFDIPFEAISRLTGFEYFDNDAHYGEPYYFRWDEVEVLP